MQHLVVVQQRAALKVVVRGATLDAVIVRQVVVGTLAVTSALTTALTNVSLGAAAAVDAFCTVVTGRADTVVISGDTTRGTLTVRLRRVIHQVGLVVDLHVGDDRVVLTTEIIATGGVTIATGTTAEAVTDVTVGVLTAAVTTIEVTSTTP